MSMTRGPVVLVEDDAGLREALERVLAATGFAVCGFGSAEAALGDRATTKARCLVLDIQLPGISGFELYERLATGDNEPAVVFITAHDLPVNHDRARQLGAIGYLIKPFSGRELAAIVAKAFA